MSKYTEALNEITKYQVELEYTMQGTDKWRNAMWTCKEALEIADRLENLDASHYISESRDWEYSYRSGFLNGYSQALADIRGDNNG